MQTIRQSRSFQKPEFLDSFIQERAANFLARKEAARIQNPYEKRANRLGAVELATPEARDASPEVMSNGTFRAVMEYGAISDPSLRQMAAIARERHDMDAHGSVTVRDIRNFAFRAESAGNRTASKALLNLQRLAETGELQKIMAGEKTKTVRANLAHRLHRFGATSFDLMDTVMTDEGEFGQVIDYDPDSKMWTVALDHFRVVQKKSGDLTKTARQRTASKDENRKKLASRLREAPLVKSAQEGPVVNLMKSSNFGSRAVLVAQDAVRSINFGFPPTSRFIGFEQVHYNADNSIHTAEARVSFRVPTPMGSHPEFIVPVRVADGKIIRPTAFRHMGREFPLTQEAVDAVLSRFGVADRPRHYRPNRIPAMIRMPDTQVRGMFGPARQLPFDFPGNPADGSRI